MESYRKVGRRRSTPRKPYWCPMLTQLWKDMRNAYQHAKRYLNSRDKRRLKKRTSNIPDIKKYRDACQCFDRELRKAKKKYQIDKIVNIEGLVKNPKRFWDAVNKLGPRSRKSVFCEAFDEQGEVTRDPDRVKKLWYDEYSTLYGTEPEGRFNEEFLQQCRKVDITEGNNEQLNTEITMGEVRSVMKTAKNGKAVGLDEIPTEALRNPLCEGVLHSLFNLCFQHGVSPQQWSRCIILPIGKGSSSISTQPLTHRGLALQSCVYKLYSLLLNKRLLNYFENNNMLHETQNGFR